MSISTHRSTGSTLASALITLAAAVLVTFGVIELVNLVGKQATTPSSQKAPSPSGSQGTPDTHASIPSEPSAADPIIGDPALEDVLLDAASAQIDPPPKPLSAPRAETVAPNAQVVTAIQHVDRYSAQDVLEVQKRNLDTLSRIERHFND